MDTINKNAMIKLLNYRKHGLNYTKGFFISFNAVIFFLFIMFMVLGVYYLDELNSLPLYLTAPFAILIISLLWTIPFNDYFFSNSNNEIDLNKILKDAKRSRQSSSYDFKLHGNEEFRSLYTACFYYKYYNDILNEIKTNNTIVKKEIDKLFYLKIYLNHRVKVLEEVCAVWIY